MTLNLLKMLQKVIILTTISEYKKLIIFFYYYLVSTKSINIEIYELMSNHQVYFFLFYLLFKKINLFLLFRLI
jgi:hypothetical protein